VPSRKAEEEIVGVLAQAGDETPGSENSCFFKGVVQRCISVDDHQVGKHLLDFPGFFGIPLDDHERFPGHEEFLNDLASGAAGAAHDDVIFHLLDLFERPPPPEGVGEIQLDDEGGEEGEPETEPRNAAEENQAGEGPSGGTKRVYFIIPDGRQGDDRHINGISQGPTLDRHIPDGADEDDGPEEQSGADETGGVPAHCSPRLPEPHGEDPGRSGLGLVVFF
jgi:hypothetical protein